MYKKTAMVMFISYLALGAVQAVAQVPRQTGVQLLQPKPAPTPAPAPAPTTTAITPLAPTPAPAPAPATTATTTTQTAPTTATTGGTTTTTASKPWTPPPGRLPDALPTSLALSTGGFQVNQVPEPGTLLLIGVGVIGLAISRRRKT